MTNNPSRCTPQTFLRGIVLSLVDVCSVIIKRIPDLLKAAGYLFIAFCFFAGNATLFDRAPHLVISETYAGIIFPVALAADGYLLLLGAKFVAYLGNLLYFSRTRELSADEKRLLQVVGFFAVTAWLMATLMAMAQPGPHGFVAQASFAIMWLMPLIFVVVGIGKLVYSGVQYLCERGQQVINDKGGTDKDA